MLHAENSKKKSYNIFKKFFYIRLQILDTYSNTQLCIYSANICYTLKYKPTITSIERSYVSFGAFSGPKATVSTCTISIAVMINSIVLFFYCIVLSFVCYLFFLFLLFYKFIKHGIDPLYMSSTLR